MAQSKTSGFPKQAQSLAAFAKALSHPARISIVTLLMEHGEACCGEIVAALPLAQPTVSQHLRDLQAAGLVTAQNCGAKVCYRLERDHIRNFCHAFQEALGSGPEVSEPRSDCCAAASC